MRRAPLATIAGVGKIGPAAEVAGALEELIFAATSAALIDAHMTIDEIDSVCMASSDLLDGRAISTMTLTAATGSFRKSELKFGDDGLAALAMGVTELAAGAADAVLVSSWSKLSDADHSLLETLGAEPNFHRPLGFDSTIVRALRASRAEGRVTTASRSDIPGGDAAVSIVLRHPGAPGPRRRGRVLGLGWIVGPYLGSEWTPLEAVTKAARSAVAEAGLIGASIPEVWVGGFHHTADDDLLEAVGARGGCLKRAPPIGHEFGYAAGLLALVTAMEGVPSDRPILVLGAAGLGDQSAYAAVIGPG